MEMKEAERSVVAKPVATRPTCSKFRSFSELLAGAINSSPTTTSVETAVAAIRPKTVRFKPAVLRAPNTGNSSQVEITGTATNDSTDKISKSSEKPTVIYKPLAKLVSKSTVSLLANMGSFKSGQHQTQPAAPAKSFTQEQYKTRSQLSISRNQSTASQAETDVVSEPLKLASQNMEEEARTSAAANTDRPSYDGYNWRKYGQKQVKGSECPRSYYKCTHPNCPVKKKVERSLDGQITEIVYKGEHNHQKPQPLKRSSSGLANVPESSGPDTNFMLNGSHPTEANDVSEGRIENQHTTYRGKGAVACDPIASATANFNGTVPDNSCGVSGEYTDGSRGVEMEDDEPSSKRRRSENQSNEAGISGEGTQDACVVVQNSADTEILGDGFRWRKYGQKVVKGNPYPRSYYRCTGLKCNVRKHVERASDDPRSFITTYEGKHNHDMPRRSANPAGSESDVQGTTIKD